MLMLWAPTTVQYPSHLIYKVEALSPRCQRTTILVIMSLARGLEPEPDFPRTDLTGANASFLELVLGNIDLIKMGHNDAEKESWVFRAGHPALFELWQIACGCEDCRRSANKRFDIHLRFPL